MRCTNWFTCAPKPVKSTRKEATWEGLTLAESKDHVAYKVPGDRRGPGGPCSSFSGRDEIALAVYARVHRECWIFSEVSLTVFPKSLFAVVRASIHVR